VFLQEHFHVRNCTYISSFCEAVSGEGVHRIPLNRSLREIVGYFQNFQNQSFHISFGHCGVHARELQALMVASAAMADHCLAAIE
jgi:hypothetical protein